MPYYTKLPVTIRAVQFDGNIRSLDEFSINDVKDFVVTYVKVDSDEKGEIALKIKTLEGEMTANKGDYIIQGVNGEYYPCKADIFHKTYRLAPSQNKDAWYSEFIEGLNPDNYADSVE